MQRAEAFRELGAALTEHASVDAVARLASTWAMRLLGAEGASVTRIDGDEYVYIAAVGRFEHVQGRRNPLEGSFTGHVILDGQPRLFTPELSHEASADRARRDQIRSGAVAPIIVSGDTVGTLGVASLREDAFDSVDLDTLVGLADFIAFGIDRE